MKTSIITVLLTALLMLGATSESEAQSRHGYRSGDSYANGHCSCGAPRYYQRYVAGYDCYGRPVWRTRVIRCNHSRRHTDRAYHYQSRRDHGRSYRHHGNVIHRDGRYGFNGRSSRIIIR